MSHVWFDRREISIESRESRKSLAAIYENVNDLIRIELEQGISADRIIVGMSKNILQINQHELCVDCFLLGLHILDKLQFDCNALVTECRCTRYIFVIDK